jgi:hypothetical protein
MKLLKKKKCDNVRRNAFHEEDYGTHPAAQQNKLKHYERITNSTNNKIYRIQTKLERTQ